MIISGDLKSFVIQSAETRNQIDVKSESSDSSLGTVYSITRLTLLKKNNMANSKMEQMESNNLESTGNLLYIFNNPFSDSENRGERQPSISLNSAQQSSESSSGSSSESSSSSSSGSSSSSSSSSSEENNGPNSNMHSTAPLHMAPNVPLLPLFVGYKGKSILMSDKIDGVERAQDLLFEIADEMQNPSRKTLEKFTILKNLLRIMNRKQYVELENRVLDKSEKQSSQEKHYNNAWNILRDALSYVGTGPALSTIKSWLQSGKIECAEAARLISKIPKFVIKPSPEYVNEFFVSTR